MLPHRAAILPSNDAITFAGIEFGSVRLMAPLGNEPPSRARVTHFTCPVLAMFHRLPSMKVLNYRKMDLLGRTTWNAFFPSFLQITVQCNNSWQQRDLCR